MKSHYQELIDTTIEAFFILFWVVLGFINLALKAPNWIKFLILMLIAFLAGTQLWYWSFAREVNIYEQLHYR